MGNSKNEVLMIQERINAEAKFQGLWKLPGGLADPGEDLAVAGCREVQEETGVPSEFVGVVSFRHSHGVRFGQGDIYFAIRLRSLSDDIKIDPEEIGDARWMSLDNIAKLVPTEKKANMGGCVSSTTYQIIKHALTGAVINGAGMPNTAGVQVM